MPRTGSRHRQSSPAKSSDAAFSRLLRKRNPAAARDTSSLSETAYRKIRQAIQIGTIGPNTHLTEMDLAAWLQMSRTPVREAMRRLESQGLLLNQPFRGAVVMTLSEGDVRDLFAVRELLETAAAGWCAQHATAAEVAAMRALIDEENRALAEPQTLIEINRRFHQAICEGAQNPFLRNALATVQSSTALLGRSNLLAAERARASHREHRAILVAIERHDRHGAARAARTHVQTSLKERLKRLAAKPAAAQS